MPPAGLQVPFGFEAMVVHEGVGRARHIVARANPENPGGVPDLYVAIRNDRSRPEGGTIALRDTTGDGVYDLEIPFGDIYGTGVDLHDGYLYRSSDTAVYRWKLPTASDEETLVPQGEPERIVGELGHRGQHGAKAFTIAPDGQLYVDVGAPSNANQEKGRTPGSPGVYPADQLENFGGIWVFDADKPGQTQAADGERFATGLRHAVALEYNPGVDALYMVMHGRDQLDSLWPEAYTNEENARLPGEEMHIIRRGDNFGWPYSYWDPQRYERIIAPEYAWKFSDGQFKQPANNPAWKDPITAFPAHWAPNDLIFYQPPEGARYPFPSRYHGAALIAFHGSWNRAPLQQEGYNVGWQPLGKDGLPNGPWETFITGFPGREVVNSPKEADYRPMGLAQGPHGELYVVDSGKGRIWRILYKAGR